DGNSTVVPVQCRRTKRQWEWLSEGNVSVVVNPDGVGNGAEEIHREADIECGHRVAVVVVPAWYNGAVFYHRHVRGESRKIADRRWDPAVFEDFQLQPAGRPEFRRGLLLGRAAGPGHGHD